MSLVYEALQKAEREKQRKTSIPSAPTPQVAPAPKSVAVEKPVAAAPVPAKSHQAALIVVAASVALVAIVAIVLMVFRQSPNKTDEPTRLVTPEVVKPATVARVHATPATPVDPVSKPSLKLTGIAPLPEGGFCAFFAGQPLPVYEEQHIEGAIVKKIEKDRVTLDINGREVVLRLF